MAWRYTGRARVNARNPQAFGRCDDCGFWYNLVDLNYQFEWAGPRLVNKRLRKCRQCLDRPFIFNKPIIYPPDPVPVYDPRPENFTNANNGSPIVPLPWPVQPIGPVPEAFIHVPDGGPPGAPAVGPWAVGGGGARGIEYNPTPAFPVFSLPPPPNPPPSIFELPPQNEAEE
jgi:hypothetical protein